MTLTLLEVVLWVVTPFSIVVKWRKHGPLKRRCPTPRPRL